MYVGVCDAQMQLNKSKISVHIFPSFHNCFDVNDIITQVHMHLGGFFDVSYVCYGCERLPPYKYSFEQLS